VIDFIDESSSSEQSNDDRFQFLFVRYLEDELDDQQWDEFNKLLRSNEAMRERFFELSSCTHLIGELLQSEQKATRSVSEGRASHGSLARRVTFCLAGIAALILVFIFYPRIETNPPADASISFLTSDVVLRDANGQSLPASVGRKLSTGETVETRGSQSLATILFGDGTRVVVAPNSFVQLALVSGKMLTVNQGTITASVSPQMVPMVVKTPQARIDIEGTEFSLEASKSQTNVHVTDGSVKLTRTTDGESVIVAKGKQVVSDELVVRNAKPAGSIWNEDFEGGLPDGWHIGTFVEDGHAGSKGAIRAERDGSEERYTIAAPQRWIDGLFVVHEDTHLHMTVKMSRPNWINMFFLIRTNDLDDPSDMAIFDAGPFSTMQPDQWYNVTVPISALKVKAEKRFSDHGPKPSERIYDIAWTSSGHDRGLVIDRVWVTRGGPGEVKRTLVNDE